MKFIPLSISGLVLIEPDVYKDDRGLFFELFKFNWIEELIEKSMEKSSVKFLQDNVSFSKKNVVRGLHYQVAPYEQGKLVTVLKGAVIDVAVDIRNNSSTFGKYVICELNDKNRNLFWIPPGFAHGFASLEDDTCFVYKCSNVYHKPSERGIRYDDPDIGVKWGVNNPIVSEKDLVLPQLKEVLLNNE